MDPLHPINLTEVMPPIAAAPGVQRVNPEQQRGNARDQQEGEHDAEEESFGELLEDAGGDGHQISGEVLDVLDADSEWEESGLPERRNLGEDDDGDEPRPHIDIVA